MNSKSLLLVAAVMASASACRSASAPDPAAEPSAGAAVGVSAGEALPSASARSAAVSEGTNALGVSAGAGGEAVPPAAAAPSQPEGAGAPGGCIGEGHACAASQAGAAKPAAAGAAHEGCLGERLAGPVEKAETTTRVDAVTGASITVAGFPLGGAPAVPLADLLARPDEFVGKAVRVEGFVATMCFHRRTWFGLRDGTREGRPLQVIAAPAFLVPQGSVGKRARVEGTLEWAEVPASAAAHLAKEHQIDAPAGAAAAVRSVMLRATGAEIF